ncbi:trafficking protein particle complex subunit 13 [Platysternon megacephalum]|uniref:Trafficking protein particle complex subunit 13 n=1 Tax=Platysternon megacephalum TaxID=55544 RepID=A0A4D9F8J0_9SAUR|nr:trafficking protein particle complex subunit 13 [Platysternon megacephalum]
MVTLRGERSPVPETSGAAGSTGSGQGWAVPCSSPALCWPSQGEACRVILGSRGGRAAVTVPDTRPLPGKAVLGGPSCQRPEPTLPRWDHPARNGAPCTPPLSSNNRDHPPRWDLPASCRDLTPPHPTGTPLLSSSNRDHCTFLPTAGTLRVSAGIFLAGVIETFLIPRETCSLPFAPQRLSCKER